MTLILLTYDLRVAKNYIYSLLKQGCFKKANPVGNALTTGQCPAKMKVIFHSIF